MPINRSPSEYGPKEICTLLDISKKTLYEWEVLGIIPSTKRDWRGWRIYSEAHIEAIREYQRRKGEKYEYAIGKANH